MTLPWPSSGFHVLSPYSHQGHLFIIPFSPHLLLVLLLSSPHGHLAQMPLPAHSLLTVTHCLLQHPLAHSTLHPFDPGSPRSIRDLPVLSPCSPVCHPTSAPAPKGGCPFRGCVGQDWDAGTEGTRDITAPHRRPCLPQAPLILRAAPTLIFTVPTAVPRALTGSHFSQRWPVASCTTSQALPILSGLWSLYAHPSVTAWSIHGHTVFCPWSLRGHPVVPSYFLHGNSMVTQWSRWSHCGYPKIPPQSPLCPPILTPRTPILHLMSDRGHFMFSPWSLLITPRSPPVALLDLPDLPALLHRATNAAVTRVSSGAGLSASTFPLTKHPKDRTHRRGCVDQDGDVGL